MNAQMKRDWILSKTKQVFGFPNLKKIEFDHRKRRVPMTVIDLQKDKRPKLV
jgi:hypothetical protein